MKVLCIGQTYWDITLLVDSYPIEGSKNVYKEKYQSGGGNVPNSGYLLGKWGVDTTIACSIGSDDYGTRIKKEYSDLGMKTEYIETSYDKDTSLSITLVNKSNISRTIHEVNVEHSALKKINYDFTPDVILIDGSDYATSQAAISNYQNALSIIDARVVTPELLELSKYTKYIICNKEFAEGVTKITSDFSNPTSLVNLYNKLQDKYPNSQIIIVLEEHGCLYLSNNEIKIMPGLKTNVIDKSGAGDIFRGAFIYSLVNNFDIDKSITLANIASGLSLSKIGARLSIPSLSEVLDYYTNKININNNIQNNQVQQVNNQNNNVNGQ